MYARVRSSHRLWPPAPGGPRGRHPMALTRTKFILPEDRIPRVWYNIDADLPVPLPPPLHPGTGQPIGPADLAPLFPMALIKQEVSHRALDRDPGAGARGLRACGARRRSIRAHRLEKALDTPARIYYKYEGVSPAGSHKPNTAIAQAYYNKQEGVKRIDHRDRRRPVGLRARLRLRAVRARVQGLHGAGRYEQKPYRRILMETYGGDVVASPSRPDTHYGRTVLAETPTRPAPGHRHQRGGGGRRQPRATPSTRWAACSTTCCCTRPSSAWRR